MAADPHRFRPSHGVLPAMAVFMLAAAGLCLAAAPDGGDSPGPVSLPVALRSGEGLAQALTRAGVRAQDAGEAEAMSRAAGGSPRAGTVLQAAVMRSSGRGGPARLLSLSFEGEGGRPFALYRSFDGALRLQPADADVRTVTTVAEGVLQGSLYESGERAGADPALVARAVRLFSQKLDFARDIHPGDHFSLVYERRATHEGRTVETGALLYAEIDAGGRVARFYAFDRDGPTGYFDETGRDVRGVLLATPVDGARITSGWGARDHPILGYTRMHQGVDFAADTGAPVLAAGDGVVAEARRWGGYGNWLRIRHPDGWETGYGHLSAYAPGVHPGVPVRQGQVVGFVGATGLATGPHLHYEVWREGVRVDPARAPMAVGVALTGSERMEFLLRKARIDALRLAAARTLPAPGFGAATDGLRPRL